MTTDETPNHALQRTRAAVTAPASCPRLSPTAQGPRQPRVSLSLGSLGALAHLLRTMRYKVCSEFRALAVCHASYSASVTSFASRPRGFATEPMQPRFGVSFCPASRQSGGFWSLLTSMRSLSSSFSSPVVRWFPARASVFPTLGHVFFRIQPNA
jgi:hypothetical protein